MGECEKACENNADCRSLTFFKSGYCTLFKDICEKTKGKGKALSLRLAIVPKHKNEYYGNKFEKVGDNVECRGEDAYYLYDSPGKVSSLAECKKACMDFSKQGEVCGSLTYFKNGYCSLFDGTCKQTIARGKAVSFRLFEEKKKPV